VTPRLLHVTVGGADVWCSGADLGTMTDPSNRGALARATELPSSDDWVWLRQVHGARVIDAAEGVRTQQEADASVTSTRTIPLAIVTADCAPVVVANETACAAVHAGHRGLLAGIIEASVAAVEARGTGTVRAFLGPCIRAECYEFGADALEPFVEQYGAEIAATTSSGHAALDIPATVRAALARAGVTELIDSGECTSHTPGYFSFRRDGTAARQATVAALR
jgi:YfiH family protein